MKKNIVTIIICWISLSGILGTSKLYSQDGDSCTTAKYFMPAQSIEPDENQVIKSQWFRFTADDIQLKITVLDRGISPTDKVTSIYLWSGTCASLSLLGTDTASSSSDSLFSITVSGLTLGSTYYFQINKNNNNDSISYFVDKDYKLLDPTCTICSPPVNPCELICNGSFELNSGVPSLTSGGQIGLACAWDRATLNTPDYYNSSATAAMYSVPGPNFASNSTTSVYVAHTGNSYVGGWTRTNLSASGGAIVNWHEYFYQQLRCPLIAGVTYSLSYWVYRSQYTGSATNFGAWFTDATTVASLSGTTTVNRQHNVD